MGQEGLSAAKVAMFAEMVQHLDELRVLASMLGPPPHCLQNHHQQLPDRCHLLPTNLLWLVLLDFETHFLFLEEDGEEGDEQFADIFPNDVQVGSERVLDLLEVEQSVASHQVAEPPQVNREEHSMDRLPPSPHVLFQPLCLVLPVPYLVVPQVEGVATNCCSEGFAGQVTSDAAFAMIDGLVVIVGERERHWDWVHNLLLGRAGERGILAIVEAVSQFVDKSSQFLIPLLLLLFPLLTKFSLQLLYLAVGFLKTSLMTLLLWVLVVTGILGGTAPEGHQEFFFLDQRLVKGLEGI